MSEDVKFSLGESEVEELLIAVGGILFAGNTISEIEIDLLERLLTLLTKEINKRQKVIH
jgi:hypothetical protein